jgi:hypothetical protein
MGSICLLSDGGLRVGVLCVTHYSFVRSFVRSRIGPQKHKAGTQKCDLNLCEAEKQLYTVIKKGEVSAASVKYLPIA